MYIVELFGVFYGPFHSEQEAALFNPPRPPQANLLVDPKIHTLRAPYVRSGRSQVTTPYDYQSGGGPNLLYCLSRQNEP